MCCSVNNHETSSDFKTAVLSHIFRLFTIIISLFTSYKKLSLPNPVDMSVPVDMGLAGNMAAPPQPTANSGSGVKFDFSGYDTSLPRFINIIVNVTNINKLNRAQ